MNPVQFNPKAISFEIKVVINIFPFSRLSFHFVYGFFLMCTKAFEFTQVPFVYFQSFISITLGDRSKMILR